VIRHYQERWILVLCSVNIIGIARPIYMQSISFTPTWIVEMITIKWIL
jgi:hypothetical protein